MSTLKDIATLYKLIEERFISVQKHPTQDLYIYNYTVQTQYDRVWNEWTLRCRGLILDGEHNIVARPLPKFFNLGERPEQEIPAEGFRVFDKLDGSLGILYPANGTYQVATRGSFTSEQAAAASAMLHEQYADVISKLSPDRTYMVEIIYPENRIVVDYGDARKLVLIAVTDNATGEDLPLEDIGLPMVKEYEGIRDIHTLAALEEENREGFVVRFASGLRLKVKFEEYVRLHRILTQISSLDLWEALRRGEDLGAMLKDVPDEFYQWVHKTVDALREEYRKVEEEAKAEFKDLGDRKENALYYKTCKHRAILFKLLDGDDYSDIIWKQIRPVYERPFSMQNELGE